MGDIDYILEEFFNKHNPFDDSKFASHLLQVHLLFKGYEIAPINWEEKE